MDIILLQDVKNLGKKGEEVTVKDGYGRNLVSKKLAAEATAKVKNDLKLQKIHEEKLAEERLQDAEALAAALSGMSVTLKIRVGKDGRAFGSVSAKEIADACKALGKPLLPFDAAALADGSYADQYNAFYDSL